MTLHTKGTLNSKIPLIFRSGLYSSFCMTAVAEQPWQSLFANCHYALIWLSARKDLGSIIEALENYQELL